MYWRLLWKPSLYLVLIKFSTINFKLGGLGSKFLELVFNNAVSGLIMNKVFVILQSSAHRTLIKMPSACPLILSCISLCRRLLSSFVPHLLFCLAAIHYCSFPLTRGQSIVEPKIIIFTLIKDLTKPLSSPFSQNSPFYFLAWLRS